jgi:hypothetical protein
MGQPRFLHRCLILAAVLAAGCGTGDAGLLASANVDEVYAGASGSSYAAISKDAADFGTLAGKVKYTGRKKPGKLKIATEFCINANPDGIMSEKFLVGSGGELAGCVVYVKRGLSGISFDVPTEPLVLDQVNCRYIPHVAVLRIGQPIVIKSSDNETHNVHIMPGANGEVNEVMNQPGQLAPMTFSKQQVPLDVRCDVHSWMQAWVAVLPHPCSAITKADGSFEIKGVPPGALQLAVWHEALGELTIDVNLAKNESKTQDFTFEAK